MTEILERQATPKLSVDDALESLRKARNPRRDPTVGFGAVRRAPDPASPPRRLGRNLDDRAFDQFIDGARAFTVVAICSQPSRRLAGCHCLSAGGQAVLWLRCTSHDHEHGGVAPVAGAGAADGSGLHNINGAGREDKWCRA